MARLRKHGSLCLALSTPRIVPLMWLVSLASVASAQWTQYGGSNQDFQVDDPGIGLSRGLISVSVIGRPLCSW